MQINPTTFKAKTKILKNTKAFESLTEFAKTKPNSIASKIKSAKSKITITKTMQKVASNNLFRFNLQKNPFIHSPHLHFALNLQ